METGAKTDPTIPGFLNEKSVTLLESRWAELPTEAVCEESSGGWKILLQRPSTVFAAAGFGPEETIASEELLKYAHGSGQKGLVERILAIFEHIRRK